MSQIRTRGPCSAGCAGLRVILPSRDAIFGIRTANSANPATDFQLPRTTDTAGQTHPVLMWESGEHSRCGIAYAMALGV
jgi:hypothetical protein